MKTNETKPWFESEFAQQIAFGVMCFLVLIGMGGCDYLSSLAKRTSGEGHRHESSQPFTGDNGGNGVRAF